MNSYQTINIIFADDHELIRDGFRSIIDDEHRIKLLAEAADGYSLLNLVEVYQPDVVITDIRMPGLNGIAATHQLQERHPHIPVIALTMFDDDHLIVDMLTCGAKGYLLKGSGKKTIIEAIESVYKSQQYYCHQTSLHVARLIATGIYDPVRQERRPILTKREKQILKLLCLEKTNSQIARELGISLRTVEGARLKMLSKTNSTNLIGLYKFAEKYGLLDDGRL